MNSKTTDTQLWKDFRKGEKYALSHIYYLYADALYRYGKKFSSDNELIKDTIQDLFFDLIRTRINLGETTHIYFYLIKAFRRKLFRSMSKLKSLSQTDYDVETLDVNIVYSVEDELINKEQLSEKEEIIRKALLELSPKQREILYYRFTCDFEYDQICEIMCIKYDSARKMVFRAIETLRGRITDTNISLFIVHIQHVMLF